MCLEDVSEPCKSTGQPGGGLDLQQKGKYGTEKLNALVCHRLINIIR